MKEAYYTTPFSFKALIRKQELQKTNIDQSIARHLRLIITTSYGASSSDELFGCRIWESEFDLLARPNVLKEAIRKDIREAIVHYEKRLDLGELEVHIEDSFSVSYSQGRRIKRKVSLHISGHIKLTNRPFEFSDHFFMGPFSYV